MNDQVGDVMADLGMVRPVSIDDEMRGSYLDYAMSVIVARALPDARDGLKPVQRRVSSMRCTTWACGPARLQEIGPHRR